MGRRLGYGDAVALLGGDPAGLAALDEALGGVLSLATGGVSEGLLNLAGAQGRILGLGRDIFGRLRAELGAADRVSRTRRLEAAHTVLVVTAYFEALAEAPLPFDPGALRMTRREQIAVARDPVTPPAAPPPTSATRGFADDVASIAPAMPSPTCRTRTCWANSVSGTGT